MKYKSIFLSGYYGVCNVGDDLLLKIIVDKLLDYNPDYKISITASDKDNISEDIKNKVCYIPSPTPSSNKVKRIFDTISHEIKLLRKHDVYIYGGGTRLFETGRRTYQSLLIKYIVLLYNIIFLKRSVIHLGNGIGSIESKLGKTLLKRILNLSTRLYLRDSNSYDMAVSNLKKKMKAKRSYDLAYLLYDESRGNRDREFFKVGLSFFQYYGYIEEDRGRQKEFYEEVLQLIERLSKIRHVEFYLFSFQKKQGGNDEDFNNQLMSDLLGRKNIDITHFKYDVNPMLFVNKLNEMSFCIGMRYHFCLLSLINNTPCIGINYQPKVRAEYEDLDIADYVVEITEIRQINEDIVRKSFDQEFMGRHLANRKNILENHFAEVNAVISG